MINNEDLSTSVVIPFYNRSKFLKRLLDSVAQQLLPIYKVYIIDNGSSLEETLSAWKIITTHSLYGRCVFTSSIGKGNANYARNLGYELAETKYVAFLDSDDWWEPKHIAQSLYVLKNSKKAGVYSGAIVHTNKKTTIKNSIDVNIFKDPFQLLFGPYIAQTSSYIINKDQVQYMVTWDEGLKRHQDFDFFASIFYKSAGWCFNPIAEVNVDWKEGGTETQNIDFLSLVLFYNKWAPRIPRKIKQRYLYDMLHLSYTHKADTKFRSFYHAELDKEGYLNNWKNKILASNLYITLHINSAKTLEKIGLKRSVKKIINSLLYK